MGKAKSSDKKKTRNNQEADISASPFVPSKSSRTNANKVERDIPVDPALVYKYARGSTKINTKGTTVDHSLTHIKYIGPFPPPPSFSLSLLLFLLSLSISL